MQRVQDILTSSTTGPSCHDEQGKQEDVCESSISGALRCTEVGDGRIYESGQVAK